jgi:cytochrome c biogenesis protein CcmG, thiol:disulfide interchange protein DsbE
MRASFGAIICLLGTAVVSCATLRPGERASSSVGLPLALAAPDLEGSLVDIGAMEGKVRVVDFWATWCEPCKEALPVLDAIDRDFGSRGLVVYGVSIDEERTQILQFLQKMPVHFPVLWDKGAVQLDRFDAKFMPVTIIADRKGVVRFVHEGWERSREREERREVEKLLDER